MGASQDEVAAAWERIRPELTTYLTRLLARPSVAEELAQETAVRALHALASAPAQPAELRPWLFRIATNLAIDERRRHRTWRESVLTDAQAAVRSMPDFLARARSLQGSPELALVAREHLAVCFSCILGQLPIEAAAALLLREVYGFSTEEIAGLLDARFGQVKHWLQSARGHLTAKYATTCALVQKRGVCYQCVELDEFFGAGQGNPLAGSDGSLDARLRILRDLHDQVGRRWTHMLTDLLDDLG